MAEPSVPDEIMILPFSAEAKADVGYDPLRDILPDKQMRKKAASVRLSAIAAGLKEFLAQVDALLQDSPHLLGDYSLDEIEVSAGMTASGKFILLGIGAESGIEGGMKFVFKRRSPTP